MDPPMTMPRMIASRLSPPRLPFQSVLCVVEGIMDTEFLRRLSARLHAERSSIPDLQQLEESGELVFLPCGGGELRAWSQRLAPLGCAEFHLYDREQSPETEIRRQIVADINRRPNCRAMLTRKRSLENYLHPHAVTQSGAGEIEFGDDDPVAMLVARRRFERLSSTTAWAGLSRRARRRFMTRVKRCLNTVAVEHLSLARLVERDPIDELLGWLKDITALVHC